MKAVSEALNLVYQDRDGQLHVASDPREGGDERSTFIRAIRKLKGTANNYDNAASKKRRHEFEKGLKEYFFSFLGKK